VQALAERERTPGRLVITTRNEGAAQFCGVPALGTGGREAYFHVEHEAGDLWLCDALTRVRLLIPNAMAPPAEDFLNQGLAMFRFLTSIATYAEPPAVQRLVQVARVTPTQEERPARLTEPPTT